MVAALVVGLAGCASVGAGGQGSVAAVSTTLAAVGSASPTAATSPVATVSSAAGPATQRVVLTPVDGHGAATTGWSVGTMNEDANAPVDCGAGGGTVTASPDAVSGGVYLCYPSAADADTCWAAAAPGKVLCVMNPFGRVVEELYVQGTALPAVAAPAAPVPLGLVLANGARCRLRDGGAWGSPTAAPNDDGYYSCDQAHGIVWAPANSSTGGIDMTGPRWTVLVGDVTGPLRTVGVSLAYYVATAR
jgi:hypothetical protein